jgi:hypothetical protein
LSAWLLALKQSVENRLTGTAGWTHVYDGDGKRVKKVTGSSGTLYWTGTGSDPIAESSRAGTNLEEYISGSEQESVTNPGFIEFPSLYLFWTLPWLKRRKVAQRQPGRPYQKYLPGGWTAWKSPRRPTASRQAQRAAKAGIYRPVHGWGLARVCPPVKGARRVPARTTSPASARTLRNLLE